MIDHFLIAYPHGAQREEIYNTEIGGCYNGDSKDILWCWDKDGEPPVEISLGHMAREEKIERAVDANGKQLYETIIIGEIKSARKRVPIFYRVAYLNNKLLGLIKKGTKPQKILREE